MVRIERENMLFCGDGEMASLLRKKIKARRRAGIILLVLIPVVITLCVLCGCGVTASTRNKQVNFDSTVYGFKVTAFDPSSAAFAPVGEFGFGSLNYRSTPVEKGQPFYAKHTVKSIWSSDPASETIIWVGRASQKSILTFEAVPDGMIRIAADGVTSGSATLSIAPDTARE